MKKLNQFSTYLQELTEEFEAYWEEQNELNPDSYPLAYHSEEEWLEAFSAWLQER